MLLLVALANPSCASHGARDAGDAAALSRVSLAGRWELLVDPADRGLAEGWAARLGAGELPPDAPEPWRELVVPGPIEQLPELADFEGVAWLRTRLPPVPRAGPPGAARRWLRFERVNHAVDAWLGSTWLGRHEGGYEAFELELPDALTAHGPAWLVLRVVDPGAEPVDGLSLATTPHAKESWYHDHGGVLGDVVLIDAVGPRPTLAELRVDAAAGAVTVRAELVAPRALAGRRVRASLRLERLGVVDAELPADAWPARAVVAESTHGVYLDADARGVLVASLRAPPDAPRWSPESPALHRVVLAVEGAHDARHFGFREPRLDARGFALDGERRVLLGVLDQPHETGRGGTAPPRAELVAEARAMRALGFDLVRAHVRPAWPAFLDACDALGLMLLEEPAIGWLRDDPALRPRLERELDAMIARDHHHPSIVLWGVLNELSGEAWRYGAELALRAAAADPTRPVLEDSGGFLGARYVPAGGDALRPMLDEHVYPPVPLPPEEAERLRTLAAAEGPSVVSEFGYGTLLDTARALAGFEEHTALDAAERALFEHLHAQALSAEDELARWGLRLREPRGSSRVGVLELAGRVQIEGIERMLAALRANPALSLIVLTQWQAVSREASAGLLAPWGELRPSAGRVTAALAPLLVDVRPARPSLRAGATPAWIVSVVNDTGAPVEQPLALEVEHLRAPPSGAVAGASPPDAGDPAAPPRETLVVPDTRFGPGVSERVLHGSLPVAPGRVRAELRARSADARTAAPPRATSRRGAEAADAVLARAECSVPPSPPAAGALALWSLGDADVAAFGARAGFPAVAAPAGGQPAVAVLRGDGVRAREGLAEHARLLRWVASGGVALVLVEPPADDAAGELVGGARGVRLLPELPVPLTVARAAGNFLGRLHLRLEVDGRAPAGSLPAWHFANPAVDGRVGTAPGRRGAVLAPGDTLLSPGALLAGAPPDGSRTAMQTLDHLGRRLGDPVQAVPYGAGWLVFAGLPLLDPVDGRHEPLRDHVLAELAAHVVGWQVAAGRLPAAEPVALDADDAAALAADLDRVRRVVDLVERRSAQGGALTSGAGSAAIPLGRALAQQRRALDALAGLRPGGAEAARAALARAVELVWSDEREAFLAREARLLDALAAALASARRADRERAFDAWIAWREAVGAQFAGAHAASLAALDRALAVVDG